MADIPLTAPAAELGRLIGLGRLDPVELADAYLTEIKATPEAQAIYARTTPERARAEAAAAQARARAGTRRGLLDGVPISWKDLFDTAGVATESGTRMLRGRVPEADAAVLANATAAGMVCLGKTHQTELAFSGLGLNPQTATPPNSLAPTLAPGGSSSGAATSVGFGLAAAGIGSDTGGSVRIPAVWNDLVGLKTSHGSLSLEGVIPLCARFDTVGPLCRTVEDAAELFAVMAAARAPDLGGADLSEHRFMVLKTPSLEAMDDAPEAAFEAALQRLSASGAALVETGSASVETVLPLSATVFPAEAYGTWGALIEARGEEMYAPVRERFQSGQGVSAPDFVRAWHMIDRARAEFAAETASYDAVLLPTCPILPPPIEALLADSELFVSKNLAALRNTRVGNLLGLSALTFPTGTPHCGVMVLAPAGGEAALLRLGAAMEKSLSVR